MTRPPSMLALSAAVALAAAAAWLVFQALSALALPGQVPARLAHIEHALHRVELARQDAGDPSAFLPHAVCTQRTESAADNLKTRLVSAAAQAGLGAPTITVTPTDSMQAGGRLAPVMFELQGTGRYEAALGLLQNLARESPEVFADTLDMKSDSGVVTLKLTGRILCSPSAT